MKIGILGCGLIGRRRGLQLKGHDLVGLYDPEHSRAESLAKELGCANVYRSELELLTKSQAQIVIIATPNQALLPLTRLCLESGVHVLVEKPAAIHPSELISIRELAKEKGLSVKVGFNHRFHPALLKARSLVDDGALGELMFLRARYGHGGRLGLEKEWRSNPEISGGGELLDQGVHILDLIYWFLGPLPLQSSFVTTSFWNTKVEDNAVCTLADRNRWATFHVSCTEWKNTFSLELYGRSGKFLISGLGNSYGAEKLTYYKMSAEMGVPETSEFLFSNFDNSWELDLLNLVDHINSGRPLLGDLNSALYALEQVKAAYRQNGLTDLPCSV